KSGDFVADTAGCVDPIGLKPGCDQPIAPLVLHGIIHAGHGGFGQRAQGIAIHIYQIVPQVEFLTEASQGVRFIQVHTIISSQLCHHSSRKMARTGDESAPAIFKGRAISSYSPSATSSSTNPSRMRRPPASTAWWASRVLELSGSSDGASVPTSAPPAAAKA